MAAKQFSLNFKGINIKVEPGLLPDGSFSDANNATSVLEGGLSPRAGQLLLPGINLGGTFIHSAHKMALGGPDANDPRYLGLSNTPSTILKVTGPYTTGVNVTSALALSNKRWDAECFNAGDSGTPTIFFAHPSRMMRDTGGFVPLRQWGIVPALRPVRLALSAPNLVVLDDNSASSTLRINTTVTSASIVMGSWRRIVPASMAGITAGSLVILNGVDTIIDAADETSFYAYSAAAPAGSIVGGMKYTASGGVADGTSFDVTVSGIGPVDWSFGGNINDGFDSDDLIGGMFSIAAVSTAGPLTQAVTIRILVNGSTVDYYEATIPVFADGSYGDFQITKADFTAVGQAGSGAYTWQNVTGYSFHITTNTIAGTPPVPVLTGNIYGSAGQGPNSASFPAATPYSYIYTLRNPTTGEEGNPSQPLIAPSAINSAARSVLVECAGVSTTPLDTAPVGDPSLVGFGSIAVYREGGVFADGLYRFVGYSTNPGLDGSGVPLPVIFIDNQSDSDIINNNTVRFDNYPPAPSNLLTPIAATATAAVGTGWTNIPLTGYAGPADLTTVLKIGSTFTIGSNANQETCIIAAVFASSVNAYLQYSHAIGEQVSCDFVVGQPCDIMCQASDALLIAGDDNNPHVVYRSKAGFPQAFPVINLETGNAHTQIIGSPDNPILGLVDYGGWYVSLNKEKIYTFQIWLGQFLNITATPSERGMIAKRCWIRVQGSLWFLSYDGIYAWSGAGSQKVTEPIDKIFRGLSVGRFKPLDYTALDKISFEYFENKVYFTYQDTSGNLQNIRYDMIYQRWEPVGYPSPITCMLTEIDTGRLLAGDLSGNAMLLEQGTEDINSTSINWYGKTAPYAPEGRTVQKQFTELMIELQNETDSVTAFLYYDYSNIADPVDSFTIAPAAGRRFVPLPLQVAGGSTHGKGARVCAILFGGDSIGNVAIFSIQLSYNPLTEIQRGRVTDWTDLGYPYDKKLYEMWIDYDMKGQTVVMNLDTITGLNGNTINQGVQQFTLTGVGRAQVNIAIEDHTVVKKVRLRPNVPNLDYEIFNWDFPGYEKYPPDVSLFTPLSDSGWSCEKVYRGYTLEINTDGVPCAVTTEVDGVDVHTGSVTTNDNDRARIITLPTAITDEIIGKMARILLAPGANGRAQVFKGPEFDFWKEPCYKNFLDTGELTFGTQSFKFIKQCWIQYLCSGGINFSIYRDGRVLFYTQALPGHTARDEERFFVPDIVGSALNKSKTYRIIVTSVNPSIPFKFYPEGSRIEWLDMSGDQRRSYSQMTLSSMISPTGSI